MYKVEGHTLDQVKDFLELVWINLKTQMYNLGEFLRVVTKYYFSNCRFCKIDFTLLLTYLFNNPYFVSKRFLLEQRAENLYVYGETPLTSLAVIARQSQISRQDTVFELGCGRGRACFWLKCFLGCKTVGIEYIPEFVTRANQIKDRLHVHGVEFRCEDFFQTDLTGATVVYLYGTCLEDAQIKSLVAKFQKLPIGTRFITVSYPLNDYANDQSFEVMKRFSVRFPWGMGDVYYQIKKS